MIKLMIFPIKINLSNKKHIITYNDIDIDLFELVEDDICMLNDDNTIDESYIGNFKSDQYITTFDNLWIKKHWLTFYFDITKDDIYLTNINDKTLYQIDFDEIKDDKQSNWYLVEIENTIVINDDNPENNTIGKNKILCNNNFSPNCYYATHINDIQLKKEIESLNKKPNSEIKYLVDSCHELEIYSGNTSFTTETNNQLWDCSFISFLYSF